jgi:type IV pilus assembly protein PilA
MAKQKGFSLIELLVVIAIILIIVSIAIPMLKNAELNMQETAVIKEVQTIHHAETQYASQFGKYAATLVELGPPAQGASSPQAAFLLPRSLAKGEKNGYLFQLALTESGYQINANPKVFGSTGRRTFYLDQNGIVHQNWGREPAAENSPEIE